MAYTGKFLHVDLTKGTTYIGETEKTLVEKFIGGKGMGFAILEKTAPQPDPLGPGNPLIFVNGPFTGTKIQTSARTTLVTKSPLTGSILDSQCGGNFGPALKRAGFDYLLITGTSEKPVYLYVTDKRAEIKDASALWGKGIFETENTLMKENPGNDPRVAAIGQAGENVSRLACIGVDKHRQFGRGGAGAVMGSKKLKAIVVDGDYEPQYFDPERFEKINLQYTREMLALDGIKYRRQKGTMKCVRSGQGYEHLPTKNFQLVQFEDFEKISSEAAREELNWKDTSCYNCGIRCSKWARWDGHEIEGPEFETTAFLGSGSMVNNIKDVAWANEMCNDYGLDTISTGIACSFAMECYEKGLLNGNNKLELTWGNAEAQRELIRQMAFREETGALLTDGTRIAAQKIGKGSEAFAINTFGMELSGINPKGSLAMGVMFAVADFASHTRLWISEQEMGPDFTIDDIPQAIADGFDTINVRNSLVICDFVPLGLDKLADLLNLATGSKHTAESLMEVGARLTHLARKYNLRNGRTYKDDTLPDRFFNENSLAGFMRGKQLDRDYFNSFVKKYYDLRGWDDEGRPTDKVLEQFEVA
ncbi:MAG: aldehyde ferredoxin oxidoreductase family protein [Bacteroidales bacterium]